MVCIVVKQLFCMWKILLKGSASRLCERSMHETMTSHCQSKQTILTWTSVSLTPYMAHSWVHVPATPTESLERKYRHLLLCHKSFRISRIWVAKPRYPLPLLGGTNCRLLQNNGQPFFQLSSLREWDIYPAHWGNSCCLLSLTAEGNKSNSALQCINGRFQGTSVSWVWSHLRFLSSSKSIVLRLPPPLHVMAFPLPSPPAQSISGLQTS